MNELSVDQKTLACPAEDIARVPSGIRPDLYRSGYALIPLPPPLVSPSLQQKHALRRFIRKHATGRSEAGRWIEAHPLTFAPVVDELVYEWLPGSLEGITHINRYVPKARGPRMPQLVMDYFTTAYKFVRRMARQYLWAEHTMPHSIRAIAGTKKHALAPMMHRHTSGWADLLWELNDIATLFEDPDDNNHVKPVPSGHALLFTEEPRAQFLSRLPGVQNAVAVQFPELIDGLSQIPSIAHGSPLPDGSQRILLRYKLIPKHLLGEVSVEA